MTVPTDTVDTVAAEPVIVKGIVLVDDRGLPEATPRPAESHDMSWILLGLFALFALLCVRLSRNMSFVKKMLTDLVTTRDRQNLFDNTVREKSLMTLMTVMCGMTTAILLYELLLTQGLLPAGLSMPAGIGMCCVATGAYCALMPLVYLSLGNVFSNSHETLLWLRGFTASQGVIGLLLFPVALVELFYPAAAGVLVPLSLVLFGIIKIVFICKGFRIFFVNPNAYLLFFYYLCSLEIVPLILTYFGANALCHLLA